MARGLERPPWWAVGVMVAGVVFLAAGLPVALHRGIHASAGPVSEAPIPSPSPLPSSSSAPPPSQYEPPAKAALMDTFTGRAGEPLQRASTGQQWTRTGSNPLVLTAAGMTIDGTGAGYTTTDLGATPSSIGAAVTFTDGSPGAVATLLVSAGPGLDLDNLGMHYYFDSTGWTVQVREHGEVPFPTLRTGKFNPPLKTDRVTVYTANVAISGSTLTITNPDGTTVSVTDPRIGPNLSGNVAWEVFRSAPGQETPAFQRVWATTP